VKETLPFHRTEGTLKGIGGKKANIMKRKISLERRPSLKNEAEAFGGRFPPSKGRGKKLIFLEIQEGDFPM